MFGICIRSLSLCSHLFFFSLPILRRSPHQLAMPDETVPPLPSVRFHSRGGTSLPADQMALWFHVDESKSQRRHVVWTLRRLRLSGCFGATGSPWKGSFCFHPIWDRQRKEGRAKWKGAVVPVYLFIFLGGGRLAAARKLFQKGPHTHTHTHRANEYMHMHSHNLIVSHRRNFNQSTCSFCSHLSAIQSAVGFCRCQITSSICQPN